MEIATLITKEKEHITKVLSSTAWDIEISARLLQISPSQLRRKIIEHGVKGTEPYGEIEAPLFPEFFQH